jgi:hypothetical protein
MAVFQLENIKQPIQKLCHGDIGDLLKGVLGLTQYKLRQMVIKGGTDDRIRRSEEASCLG